VPIGTVMSRLARGRNHVDQDHWKNRIMTRPLIHEDFALPIHAYIWMASSIRRMHLRWRSIWRLHPALAASASALRPFSSDARASAARSTTARSAHASRDRLGMAASARAALTRPVFLAGARRLHRRHSGRRQRRDIDVPGAVADGLGPRWHR